MIKTGRHSPNSDSFSFGEVMSGRSTPGGLSPDLLFMTRELRVPKTSQPKMLNINLNATPIFPDSFSTSLVKANKEITFGDFHSNAWLFFSALCQIGLINNFEYSIEFDKTLLIIKEILTKDGSQIEFKDRVALRKSLDLLDVSRFNHNNFILRLLGDILADRGENDFFILEILRFLNINKVKFEIIFSNHDMVHLEFYELFIKNKSPSLFNTEQLKKIEDPKYLSSYKSLYNLVTYLDHNKYEIEEYKNLMTSFYLPHLRLFSINKENILYTHAVVGKGLFDSVIENLLALSFREFRIDLSIDNERFFANEIFCSLINRTTSTLTPIEGEPSKIHLWKLISDFVNSRDVDSDLPLAVSKGVHGHHNSFENSSSDRVSLNHGIGQHPQEKFCKRSGEIPMWLTPK